MSNTGQKSCSKQSGIEDGWSKQIENPEVRNADNEFLGQFRGGRTTVGHVDEINGHGAEEIQSFVPTRHELVQLAKYWAKKAIDIDYLWFLYPQFGSSDIRVRAFAWRRVSRIVDMVGEKEVDEAVKQTYEEYGKGQQPRAWNIFLNGTADERKAFRKEIDEIDVDAFFQAEANRESRTKRKAEQ